jgi:maltooligosyltrehalose trehalohydrolase
MFAAPGLPLLFMGEEYGETAPFQYFTSFLDRNLAEAVRRGRTLEFAKFAWQGQVADPGDPATFVRSRLNHSLVGAPRHRELHHYYRRWLALRRDHPALGARHKSHAQASLDEQGVLTLVRRAPSGEGVYLLANLTAEPKPRNADPAARGILLDSADVQFAGPGRVTPLAPYQVQLYELTR